MLPRTNPLAAVINESAVAKLNGECAATYSTLRFEHQHVDAGSREQPRRVQTRQPSADHNDIAGVPRCHKAILELLQQIEVVAVRVLETDHAGAPGLVLWRTVKRYTCGL